MNITRKIIYLEQNYQVQLTHHNILRKIMSDIIIKFNN